MTIFLLILYLHGPYPALILDAYSDPQRCESERVRYELAFATPLCQIIRVN